MRDGQPGRRRVHGLPSDFDYVLNLAVAKSGDWDKDLGANAESVGLLMAHCRNAKAFLHCSSAAVYDPPDDEPRSERAALGDNHKPLFPTYSISKIAGEVVARTMARTLNMPTVIARLNVPYGDNGGWPFYHMEMMLAGIPIPVPAGVPASYNPIHEDDIIATIPKLLAAASVPATTVNWCGDQTVSLQEWCRYLGSLVGKEPVFEESATGAARQSHRRVTDARARRRQHGRLAGRAAPDGGQIPPGVDRRVTVVGMFVKRAQRAFAVYEGRRTHIPRNPNNVGCV